jgi:hypothetical protein
VIHVSSVPLFPFESVPGETLQSAEAHLKLSPTELEIGFQLGFPFELNSVQDQWVSGERSDGLWKGNCLECFLALDHKAYLELNVADDGDWALYHFTNYREGMAPAEVERVEIRRANRQFHIRVRFTDPLPSVEEFNLSVVRELSSRHLQFWAHQHPLERPDFHDRSCWLKTKKWKGELHV